MLLENGFEMTSVDASDKMLKQALRIRWSRRKEPAFDKWGIYLCLAHERFPKGGIYNE